MRFTAIVTIGAATLALAACGNDRSANRAAPAKIRVQSDEQKKLHTLDAFNLAIGLKHAIYDAGYTCKQVTDAGYVGEYQNLDMWTATCADKRQWAVFAGPDGSAQVRDCKDIPGSGLPTCEIKQRPKGDFNKA